MKQLLEDRDQLLNALVHELKTLRKRFSTPRRTRLVEGGDELMAEKAASQRPNTELLRKQALAALPGEAKLLIHADGQVKVISPQVLGRLHLNEPCALGDEPSPARLILPIEPPPRLLVISAGGRVALLRWEFAGQQPGTIDRFLPAGLDGDPIVAIEPLPEGDGSDRSLGLLSSDGRFKRLPLREVLELSGRATSVVKLKEGVQLKAAMICREGTDLVLVSDIGRILRLPINESVLPLMGRLAQGPMTMRLLPGETLVGGLNLPPGEPEQSILMATTKGRLTRIASSGLRLCQRGDLGEIAVCLEGNEDRVMAICAGHGLVGLATDRGRHGRFSAEDLACKELGETLSDQLDLKADENLSNLVRLIQ